MHFLDCLPSKRTKEKKKNVASLFATPTQLRITAASFLGTHVIVSYFSYAAVSLSRPLINTLTYRMANGNSWQGYCVAVSLT